jgi:catechol 2,3-dioxygenase-like lactoylglutathione lyase family enzyme
VKARLNHVGQVVPDLDRAIAFYELFGADFVLEDRFLGEETSRGLGIDEADARCAMMTLGDSVIELIQYVNPSSGSIEIAISDAGAAHLAIEVEDIDAAVAELSAAGVRFETPPIHITEGVFTGNAWCYCYGPDGILVELQQPGVSIKRLLWESPRPERPSS